MDRSSTVKLISLSYENNLGVLTPIESERTVFCNVSSVTQSEFFEGGRNGFQPEYRLTMLKPEYRDERLVELKGNRYSVYRTYEGRNDTIELYIERRVGN